MPELELPWGGQALKLSLPDHWRVAQVAAPTLRPAPADWPDRLAEALVRAESSPPLAELLREARQGRICLIVEDITRPSPLKTILPILLRELDHAGIDDRQVEILFATGMHPPMTGEQVAEKIGPLADRFAWRCNDARDLAGQVRLGEVPLPNGRGALPVLVDRGCAEAALRIVVSSVAPHLQAGFGGGLKMIVPGCAELGTISRLHLAGLGRPGEPLVGTAGERNPMRRMIDAVGALLDGRGRTFGVQYLLDGADQPSSIVAGNLQRAQDMLAKQSAVTAGIVVDSPADILITNAYPRDFDLWQSFKCIPNTHAAVRRGGAIIALARCPAGVNMGPIRWPFNPRWTRRLLRWIGVRGLVSTATRLAPGINPEAKFFVQLAAEALYRNPIYMYAPELVRRGDRFPGLPVSDDLAAIFQAVDEELGEGSRRVVVFPAGGTTYPVIGR